MEATFERLLNRIQYDLSFDTEYSDRDLSFDTEYSDGIVVTMSEVTKAVQTLGVNKAAGLDGIFAERLIYSNDRLYTMLPMCLTDLFGHCFLPTACLRLFLYLL